MDNLEKRDKMQRKMHQWIDTIAAFFGSVTFLLINTIVFIVWITVNTAFPTWLHFDSFPFNFLTLSVSLEAIYLSIFVLISQNRQGERDRKRAEADHLLNVSESRQEQEILTILDKQNEALEELKQLVQASKRTRKSSTSAKVCYNRVDTL